MPRVDIKSENPKPTIGIYSFGESTGGPLPIAQFEFDVTKFRDPAGQQQFKSAKNGTDPDVRDWVCQDRRLPAIIATVMMLSDDLLQPHKKGTGTETLSSWVSFSFRDFHGRWIAPAIAEAVANHLSGVGYTVAVIHQSLPAPAQMKMY